MKQWPEKVFSTVMMDTLKCLRPRPIGSNTKSPHGLIPYYCNSLTNSGYPRRGSSRSPCLRDYPDLAAEQLAALELARHEAQHFIEYWTGAVYASAAAKRRQAFQFDNHWFYSMLALGRDGRNSR